MSRFLLKACEKCWGDLVLDEGDWLCLQCGTYYYTGLYRKNGLTRWPEQPAPPPRMEKTLRLDQPVTGSLVGQEVSPSVAQKAVFLRVINLSVSVDINSQSVFQWH